MTTPCGPERRSSPGIWKNEPFGLFMQTVSRRSAARAGNCGFAIAALLWRTMWPWTSTVAVPTALAMGCVSAQSQLWPQRPVHTIAPYAAGGNSDGIARIVAQRLTDAFGQTFVVENRLGANGAIATDAVARSPA